jgi:hypothetical protein
MRSTGNQFRIGDTAKIVRLLRPDTDPSLLGFQGIVRGLVVEGGRVTGVRVEHHSMEPGELELVKKWQPPTRYRPRTKKEKRKG